jgi:hypothetical protein
VETVGEIEGKRGDHHDQQQKQLNAHGFDSRYRLVACPTIQQQTRWFDRPVVDGGRHTSIGQQESETLQQQAQSNSLSRWLCGKEVLDRGD